jgi:polyhydroxybutyrate depolymerase
MLDRIPLVIDGIERCYWRWIPPNARDVPLVMFLHGTGASAPWANRETGWSQAAQNHRFALALPEALPQNPLLPPHFRDNPQRWRDETDPQFPSLSPPAGRGKVLHATVSPFLPHAEQEGSQVIDDVAFLDAVIDQMLRNGSVDNRRVYVTGFSNGAAMTFQYAARRSHRLAAIAPVAGYCRGTLPPSTHPVPTLYLIGDADPLVPLHGGQVPSPWEGRLVRRPPVAESLERWAAWLGCSPLPRLIEDTPLYRREIYPGAVTFEVLIVKGLGHHWPGGRGGWSARIAGPHHTHLNATDIIWHFFCQHSIPTVAEGV